MSSKEKTVRQIRQEISEECGHDIDAVLAYYRAVEEELKRTGEFQFVKTRRRGLKNGRAAKKKKDVA
jgi:hypothetical protein